MTDTTSRPGVRLIPIHGKAPQIHESAFIAPGCTIEDRGFVGLGAIAMNKAVIASDAMLAAGAMLTETKVMGARELWGGRPARKMRDLDDAAVAGMKLGVAHYAENAKHHAAAIAGIA